MQMCQSHWNALKDAIKLRGMESLIAKSGEEAVERLTESLKNEPSPESFDPLMAAHNLITYQALECGGLYMMFGDLCPLCELEKHTETKADSWINGASNDCYKHAVELKLITAN